MRIMLDVNVVLDVLFDRKQHVASASALWAKVERKELEGYLPAHGVTTIFYLATREKSRAAARHMIELLLRVFRVGAIDHTVITRAMSLSSPDFEDAVCAACAEAIQCDALVTRDPKGFKGAPLPVLDPTAALAWIRTAQSST
ncbi:MAG TPA: PIN domain-containing protein [Polyangiaceae bacterium]|nr:PIN domain-containing protein [Polyangiaceae bacterium]